jgi:hypothetical protein
MNTSDFSTSFEKTSDTYPVYHVTSVSDLLRRLKALLFAVAFIVGAYSIADPSFAYFLKQTGTAAVMNAIEWVTPIASAQTRDSSGGITPASKMLLAQVTEKTKDEAQVSSTETVTYLNAAAENFFDIINRFIRITTTVRLGKEIRPLSGSVATQNLDLELVTPNANTQQNSIRGQLQNQIQNSNQNSNSGAKTIATGTTQAATVGTNTSRVSQVQQTEVPASLSQRIIERIIQPTGLSELQVRSIIDQSVNGLRSDLARLSSVPTTPVNYNYISPQVFGQAQRIDQLTNTIITSPTITNATVIGGTFAPTTINSTGNYAIGTGAGTANTLGSSTSTNTINGETIINNSLAIQGGTDYVTTGSQNDVDLGTASTVRYIGAGIATFTGLDNGADGKILILHNDSGSTLSLANEDVLSTAQNRIVTGSGAQLDLTTGKAVMLQYDASALRWRVVGGTGSGGPGNFTTLTTSDAVTLNDDMTFGDAITDTFTINSGEITTPNNLSFDTNTLFIDAANNSVGIGTNSPNSTLDVNGGVSFRAGANFTSTGALDDVNLGSNTMVRFDGAAPTTFSGIADGTDGKVIVLHNASSSVLTLNNDDTNSLAQNRIITGTGGSLALPSGSAVMLQYDSTLFVWRIIGASGTVGGSSFTTLTSSGNSTIGTGAGTNNTFGTGTGTTNTIGEVTGTNTINGTTTITDTISMNGDTIIGNTTSDRLLVTSHLLGSNALVFQGATDNASETTFTITDPTADRTITFKDGTGTVAFLSDTLSPVMTDNTADAYDLQEGSNNYLNITTTNASENISFGNATTNPTFSFLGSGLTTFTGATTTNGTATFNGNITQSGASTFSTGTGLATFNGNITQSGAGTVTTGTGLFTAGGAATITGLLTANGNITQSGAGTVTTGTGLFTAGGNATVTGNLTTTGTSTFTGSQTLVGNTDLQGTLADSTGNLTITDAVDVTGKHHPNWHTHTDRINNYLICGSDQSHPYSFVSWAILVIL